MNRYVRTLGLAALAAAMLSVTNGLAQQGPGGPGGQGRGNFDPEQMRQRMMERYKEQLDVQNDAEWKVIEERVGKVLEARRSAGGGFGGPMMMGRRGGGPGGDQGGQGGQGGDRRARFGGEPNPDAEALQKAIEAKASNDEIKAKLAKYRESRKERQAKLTQAQDELRKLLSVRQEATAVMMGLLD